MSETRSRFIWSSNFDTCIFVEWTLCSKTYRLAPVDIQIFIRSADAGLSLLKLYDKLFRLYIPACAQCSRTTRACHQFFNFYHRRIQVSVTLLSFLALSNLTKHISNLFLKRERVMIRGTALRVDRLSSKRTL